jgi:hypothetical protein
MNSSVNNFVPSIGGLPSFQLPPEKQQFDRQSEAEEKSYQNMDHEVS